MLTENTIVFRKEWMDHFENIINEKIGEHWQMIENVNVAYQKEYVVAVFDCDGMPEIFNDENFEYEILETKDVEGTYTQKRNEAREVVDSRYTAKTLLKKMIPLEDYDILIKDIQYTF